MDRPLPPASTDPVVLTAQESSPSVLFPTFTATTAWTLGLSLRERILSLPSSQRRPALISISLGGAYPSPHVVFQCATEPGTVADNEEWVRRKRATVLRWGVSSWLMRRKVLAGLGALEGGEREKEVEGAFVRKFALKSGSGGPADEYAIHGGGFPVRVTGVDGVVGVIVVSGLKQEDDHQVVVETVREFVGEKS
ncbi:DUF967 domain protein [Aspergillus campestris IBT 28561]|uniref:DUF967 domain protein n=1 Tax=Aspergillus campestris (strain IBT 28561) TaxID=1392248 RepID=A0A2I1D0C2_ASPC2|nr:DUF967 domain protein [Aspergillus campestris IBT 28561]PKY03309.1 DUF967 domain protein [Aspergillus campestris IBT 28561]